MQHPAEPKPELTNDIRQKCLYFLFASQISRKEARRPPAKFLISVEPDLSLDLPLSESAAREEACYDHIDIELDGEGLLLARQGGVGGVGPHNYNAREEGERGVCGRKGKESSS